MADEIPMAFYGHLPLWLPWPRNCSDDTASATVSGSEDWAFQVNIAVSELMTGSEEGYISQACQGHSRSGQASV